MVFKAYAKASSMMAMWRDNCKCPMCGSTADESDHVFGRSRPGEVFLDHWMLRMSLCHKCHYKKHHGGGFNKVEQVKKLKNANEAFIGSNEASVCYFALREGLAEKIVEDLDRAQEFIDNWLAKNG